MKANPARVTQEALYVGFALALPMSVAVLLLDALGVDAVCTTGRVAIAADARVAGGDVGWLVALERGPAALAEVPHRVMDAVVADAVALVGVEVTTATLGAEVAVAVAF
jgi:hypothetical protein